MKRVCAWCGRALDQPERREDLRVTHGVCTAEAVFSSHERRRKPILSLPGKMWVTTGRARRQQRRQ